MLQPPHCAQVLPDLHWLVVGQLLVTPSQVTEVLLPEHTLPEHETVWEGAKQ